jgi:hypothetical protein
MKRYFSKNLFLTVLIAIPLFIGPVFVNAQYYDDYGAYDSYFGGGSYFSDYGAYDNYFSDYGAYDNYFSDYSAYDNYFSGDSYYSDYNAYDNYLGNYFDQSSYNNYYSDYNAYDNYFSQDAYNSYYDGYNSYDNYINDYFSQDAYDSYYQDYNAYDNYFSQDAYDNYYSDYNVYDDYFGQQYYQDGYCESCSQGGYCPAGCYSQGYEEYCPTCYGNQYYNNPGFYAGFNYVEQPPVIIQQPPIIQPPVIIQQPPIVQPPVVIQQPPIIQQPCVNCAVPQEEICYDCPPFDDTEEVITTAVYTYANTGAVSKTEVKVVTIKMFVKNSSDSGKWSKEIDLKTTDEADLMITVLNNTDNNLSNVILKLNIPEEINYSTGYNLDGEKKTGDLTKGVDIGSVSANDAKIITFSADFNKSKFSNNETKQLSIEGTASAKNYNASDSVMISSQNIQTQTAAISSSAFKNWYMWFLVVLIIILLVLLFNRYYSAH